MITTILDQVSRLLGQAYLVSTLTPWLMFWTANAVTVASLVGASAIVSWWEAEVSASATMLAAVSAVVVLVLAASALTMNGVYAAFRRTLEGDTDRVGLRLLASAAARRRCRLNRGALDVLAWERRRYGNVVLIAQREKKRVAEALMKGEENPLSPPSEAQLEQFASGFDAASPGTPDGASIEKTADLFVAAFGSTDPASYTLWLERWRERISRYLEAASLTAAQIATKTSDVSAVDAAPTEYGEVLASASRYVSARYGIDSIVFWSRLQPVIPKEYLSVVEDAKARMDMLTALTLLALVYSALWYFVLPYFGVTAWTLVATCGGGVTAATLFYAGSVEAARSFGETLRSSFDLYRHDLLEKLGFSVPETLEAEKDLWISISRFVLYKDAVRRPFADESGSEDTDKEPDVPETKRGFWGELSARVASRFKRRGEASTPPPAPALPPPVRMPPRPEQGRQGLRVALDVVTLAVALVLVLSQIPTLMAARGRRLVLGPAAARPLAAGTLVQAEDIEFRLTRRADTDRLVLEPADIEGRGLARALDAGAAFTQADLQDLRAPRIVSVEVSSFSPLTANSRVDLWRIRSAPSGGYLPVLSGAEIVGVVPRPPAAAPAGTAPRTPRQATARAAASAGSPAQQTAPSAAGPPATPPRAEPAAFTVWLKVPADWSPEATDSARTLLAVPSAAAGSARQEEADSHEDAAAKQQ